VKGSKRISFIVNNFPPIIDGVGDYTYRLLEILYNRHPENRYYIITKATISIEIRQKFKNVIFYKVDNWDIKTYLKILKFLKTEEVNILHLQYVPYSFDKYGIPFLLSLFLLFARLFRNCKLVVTFHEVRIKREFRKNIVISILQGLIAKAIYLASHKTITSNNFYRNLIWKNGTTKIIPIGSNITPFVINSAINKSHQNFVITSFGSGIKSYKIILEAIALLKKVIDNIELKFIGNIKETELYHINKLAKELGIKNLLNITGYLPSEQVYEELVKSDVYLMLEDIYKPSSWKGISHKSGTFAAALSAGLPIIAFEGELTDKDLTKLPFIYYSKPNTYNITKQLIELSSLSITQQGHLKNEILSYYQSYLDWQVIFEDNHNLYHFE